MLLLISWLISCSTASPTSVVNGGGFSPVGTRQSQKVSASDRNAVRKLLEAETTKCHYTRFGDEHSVLDTFTPEIIDVPHPCPTKTEKFKPACVGTVYCHSSIMNFMVSNTVCWARDSNHCPSAKVCAQSSQLVFHGLRDGLIGYSIFYDRRYAQRQRGK